MKTTKTKTKTNHKRGQKGFTLIELLVVVAILGVLAGVAVPAYSKFFGAGQTEAKNTEVSTVQAAMDAMMANNKIVTVTAQNTFTDNFSALPVGAGSEVLSVGYIRVNPTSYCYTWDNTGRVTQGVKVAGVCP